MILALRVGLTICGLCLGAYAAYAAYEFNASMHPGESGVWFARTMVVLTCGSWMLLIAAGIVRRLGWRREAGLCRIGWFVLMLLVLFNSAGFNVGGRRQAVAEKAQVMADYDRTVMDREQASRAFDAAVAAKRWSAAKTFQSRIEADDKILAGSKKIASSDAQADLLAFTGITGDAVGVGLPIVTTVVVEVAANLFFWAAELIGRSPLGPVEQKPVEVAVAEPMETAKKPPRKRRNRRRQKRVNRDGSLPVVRSYPTLH
jgi:hypothetical protein